MKEIVEKENNGYVVVNIYPQSTYQLGNGTGINKLLVSEFGK
jgi:hypothetical protein